ncbi:hypothetical protein ACFPRL_11755 [Pseudoclavibacter helvolus]
MGSFPSRSAEPIPRRTAGSCAKRTARIGAKTAGRAAPLDHVVLLEHPPADRLVDEPAREARDGQLLAVAQV